MNDKPLSETHPSIYRERMPVYAYDVDMNMTRNGVNGIEVHLSQDVQKQTVDIAEYKRLKKEYEKLELSLASAVHGFQGRYGLGIAEGRRQSTEEIERLKKELEELKEFVKGEMVSRDDAAKSSHEAFLAGERRIIARVREMPITEETFREVFGCVMTVSAQRPISPEECGCLRCSPESLGIAEGERRAMERVRNCMNGIIKRTTWSNKEAQDAFNDYHNELWDELGLWKEVEK